MQSVIAEISELNPYHKIFTDNSEAILFMVKHHLIVSGFPCRRSGCDGVTKIQNTTRFSDGMGFRCKNKKCKSLFSIKVGSRFEGLTVDCKKILRCIFCWINSYANFQAVSLCQISEPSYIKIKGIILEILEGSGGTKDKIDNPK